LRVAGTTVPVAELFPTPPFTQHATRNAFTDLRLRITVLLGGTSSERDVSLASGLRIIAALRERGHEVAAVDPAAGVVDATAEAALRGRKVDVAPPSLDALAKLGKGGAFIGGLAELPAVREADVVFLALHGGYGEDGTVQALLDLAGVRYTGSGHLASALAMDKDLTKTVLRAAGVGTADWAMVRDGAGVAPGAPPRLQHAASAAGGRHRGAAGGGDSSPEAPGAALTTFLRETKERLGLPLIVKPSKQGSTVGLTLVKDAAELAPAVAEAGRYDDEVMIECFVPGRELTVGVLGGEPLPVGEIFPEHEIYDYECKYTAGMAREEFPAKLSADDTRRVQEQAVQAFHALKLRGCARIDFRMTPAGDFYCLEANTLPGMTELSLIPQGAAVAGMEFGALCERIVGLAT
jgi:D-alanine-D-alanine ligase